jgi:hypothetical protein
MVFPLEPVEATDAAKVQDGRTTSFVTVGWKFFWQAFIAALAQLNERRLKRTISSCFRRICR